MNEFNARKNSILARAARQALVLMLMFFIMGAFTACGEAEDDREVTAKVFLEVDDFEYLRKQGALVLDVRGKDTFADGHVPGAINASWRDFVYPDKNGIVREEVEDLQKAARAMGINADQTVLIYGDGGVNDSSAGRMFWTLEYLGHENVYLLNGGIESYKRQNLYTQAGTTTAKEGTFTVNLRPEIRATMAEVKEASDKGELKIIDSRTDAEWLAELEKDPRGNQQGGHIPEAIHYHWEDVMAENGTLRPREELLAEFKALGITEESLTITYCQSGVRSGFLYAVLKWLDYKEAKNYDGSWWEWSQKDNEMPIVNEPVTQN